MAQYEGFRNDVYPDPVSKGEPYTVGTGITYKPNGERFRLGETYPTEQLHEWEYQIVSRDFLPPLKRLQHWENFSDGQKIALISFAWNLGADAIGNNNGFATITKMVQSPDWPNSEKVFRLYNKSGGRYVLGLDRRRYGESLVSQGVDIKEAFRRSLSH